MCFTKKVFTLSATSAVSTSSGRFTQQTMRFCLMVLLAQTFSEHVWRCKKKVVHVCQCFIYLFLVSRRKNHHKETCKDVCKWRKVTIAQRNWYLWTKHKISDETEGQDFLSVDMCLTELLRTSMIQILLGSRKFTVRVQMNKSWLIFHVILVYTELFL